MTEDIERLIMRHRLGCEVPGTVPPAWVTAAAQELAGVIDAFGRTAGVDSWAIDAWFHPRLTPTRDQL